jgi:hypothetical protein
MKTKVSVEKKFKEFKNYCRVGIVRPDFIPDDFRWAATYHILRTYFAYCITEKIIERSIVDIVCEDICFQKEELQSEFDHNDLLIQSLYITSVLEDWLELALELELFETAQNLKNIFDYCE